MIPILFEQNTTSFTSNGLGRLPECIRCLVTEERNGIYECQFEYPITGAMYKELQKRRIILCTHDDKKDLQPFEIYARSIPDVRGVVTFYAHHISYKLNNIVVMPFTASTVADALSKIKTYSANPNPFTFWTDKNTVAQYKSEVPRSGRNMLGGEENSILDVFGGGEYEFDGFNVKLYAHRGQDSGVDIRYAKNLINLNQNIDISSCYNAVAPYWADMDGRVVTLPEKILYFGGGEPIDAVPMDLSSDFEQAPTASQLRTLATTRYQTAKPWLPNENITVDFVQLWQTEEYKDFTGLQRVSLCDTVSVYYEPAGVEAVKQKVVKTVYNVLLERYDQIELGELQTSLGKAISQDILEVVPTTSMMESAIQYATDLIRGGLGGYVVMTPGENGYPQEILIMDTPDVNTAVNVWRFNQGGLGHSHNGYNGPYDDIALTQDGRINASMITTGIINANLIQTGTLNADLIQSGIMKLGDGPNLARLELYDGGTKTGELSSDGALTFYSSRGYTYYYKDIDFWENDSSSYPENALSISSQPASGSWHGSSTFGLIETRSELEIRTPYQSSICLFSTPCSAAPNAYVLIKGNTEFRSDLTVWGTKSRRVETDSYSDRLLYCYETPTPLFGDIGEAVIDEEGLCYVDIDDIFSETIADKVEYQVFLQAEGEGSCYIAEKTPRYFVIKGTPRLKVAWELKAKQRDYENIRLEQGDIELDEYETRLKDDNQLYETFIKEQEDILYGYN